MSHHHTSHSANFLFRSSKAHTARKILASVFLGLCVLGVGIGYLGNVVDFFPWENFTLLFPGWGAAVFLIVPALYCLIRFRFSTFFLIVLSGGALIVLSCNGHMRMKSAWVAMLSVLIILIGLRIILNPLIRRFRERKSMRKMGKILNDIGQNAESDHSDCSVRFGEHTADFTEQTVTSVTASCEFGQLNLNMRNALFQECAVLDVQCAFGELNIFLPSDVHVEVLTGSVAFGGVNNHKSDCPDSPTVIYINTACSFGEINIS